MFAFWCVVAILCVTLEMGNPGLFFFLSFACGALCAALVSVWYCESLYQCITFIAGTLVSIVALRSWIATDEGRHHGHKTNINALIGKKGFVVEEIKPQISGAIKIGGETWSAKSIDHTMIPTGSIVEIVSIQGSYAVVRMTMHNSLHHLK